MQHNHNFLTKLRVQYSLHDTTLSVTGMKHDMFEKKMSMIHAKLLFC